MGEQTHPQGALLSFSSTDFIKTGTLPALQTLLVPDARTSIEGVTETKDHLFITLIRNVKGQILQFAYKNNNWTSTPVDLPQTGSLSISSANPFTNAIFINYEDHITPDTLYEYDAETKKQRAQNTCLHALMQKALWFTNTKAKVKMASSFLTSSFITKM